MIQCITEHTEKTMKLLLWPMIAIVLSMLHSIQAWAEEADLIGHMGRMQYFTHKTGLAINAQNKTLATFYAHEMEHSLNEVMKIESFDGHPISRHAENILLPVFKQFETALEKADWSAIQSQYRKVIKACNQCHTTTEHEFIIIRENPDNPYLQDFNPPAR
jgi:hypothetical protein